jgi:hypothetical protein
MNQFILLEETNIVLKVIGGILMCGLFIAFYIGMVKVMSWITGKSIGYKGKSVANPNDIGDLFNKKNKEENKIHSLKPGGKDAWGCDVPIRNQYTIERLITSIKGLDELDNQDRYLQKYLIEQEISLLFSSDQMTEQEHNLLMNILPPF